MVRLTVNVADPDRATLDRAAAIIRGGGVVALPTDTLYGLAANPFDPEAVSRVFRAKGRAADQALPLIACDARQIAEQLGALPAIASALAERFWPGPLTLLIPAPSGLAPAVSAGTGRVGVRVPAHQVARDLCRRCDSPLTATSANLSGQPPSDNPDDVMSRLTDVDALLDAGRAPGGPPSTIVDVTGDEVTLVRAGAIGWDEIQACLQRA